MTVARLRSHLLRRRARHPRTRPYFAAIRPQRPGHSQPPIQSRRLQHVRTLMGDAAEAIAASIGGRGSFARTVRQSAAVLMINDRYRCATANASSARIRLLGKGSTSLPDCKQSCVSGPPPPPVYCWYGNPPLKPLVFCGPVLQKSHVGREPLKFLVEWAATRRWPTQATWHVVSSGHQDSSARTAVALLTCAPARYTSVFSHKELISCSPFVHS